MKNDTWLKRVKRVVNTISFSVFGRHFAFIVSRDKIHTDGRIYVQVSYVAPCTKTGDHQVWHGRKWYLSEYMTADEIVKTCYCAAEAAVKHEIMEGFKVNDTILFNPHVDYRELLKISHKEVKRK